MTGASEHLIFNLELCKWIFCCLLIKQKHLVELAAKLEIHYISIVKNYLFNSAANARTS